MPDADFEMTVADVFVLAGRGTVAAGVAVRGVFRSGQIAQVWHDGHQVGNSVAHVELYVRPGTVALLLTDPAVHVQPGYLIRSTPRSP